MTIASKYLEVLAKIMCNNSTVSSVIDKEKYNKLYYTIYSELKEQFNCSSYPHTTEIFNRFDNMMKGLESFYIFPDIIEKRSILIYNFYTNSIFSVFNKVFMNKKFISSLKNIYTKIPIIMVNSDKGDLIEILNYANVRVSLTVDEYKRLIVESRKKEIALNKIIKCIYIKTKMTRPDICLVSDNIYGNAEKMFYRCISKKILNIDLNIDNKKIESINNNSRMEKLSAFIVGYEDANNIKNISVPKNIVKIENDKVIGYIKKEVNHVLYGFLDEFTSIKIKIRDYYERQQINVETVLKEIIKDIVRTGIQGDEKLIYIREHEKVKLNIIKSEADRVYSLLYKIDELVKEICEDLGDNYIDGKQISRYTMDLVFESIFSNKDLDNNIGKKLLSRLKSFKYDNEDLLNAYVRKRFGNEVTYVPIDIKDGEWEKAKMLIFILEPECIPLKQLKEYIRILGERCSTGKELYSKALISKNEKKIKFLQESLGKGYEKAGVELLEMYKKNIRGINLLTLANYLIPEACMMIADKNIKKYNLKKCYADIYDEKFNYYKIAATKQYYPAIEKIVDIVFESRFSSGFQISKSKPQNKNIEEMINNGKVICKLCRFLINQHYKVNRYSEILGIVLFSLNENLSESMRLLRKANTGLGFYCKGHMYEFGGGVAIDLKKAIDNYEKALDKGFEGRTEERLSSCYRKIENEFIEQNRDVYYDKDTDYQTVSRRTGRYTQDDTCFAPGTRILMADGTYSRVEDIKVNDIVVVYDHYEGKISEDKIIANIHMNKNEKEYKIINMNFDNNRTLKIVQSHVLFDYTEMKYIWIDENNIEKYIGHEFAMFTKSGIKGIKLLSYYIEVRITHYYAPISRYHLNVFAEDLLTMPPTELTLNIFNIKKDMCYDLSELERFGKTSYEEIQDIVSIVEYFNLPCEYLNGVMEFKGLDLSDFEHAMKLFRN